MPSMVLKFGVTRIPVSGLGEASRVHSATVQALFRAGKGASDVPRCCVIGEDGKRVADLSQNSRVWGNLNDLSSRMTAETHPALW
jgi:hypothetical protein